MSLNYQEPPSPLPAEKCIASLDEFQFPPHPHPLLVKAERNEAGMSVINTFAPPQAAQEGQCGFGEFGSLAPPPQLISIAIPCEWYEHRLDPEIFRAAYEPS